MQTLLWILGLIGSAVKFFSSMGQPKVSDQERLGQEEAKRAGIEEALKELRAADDAAQRKPDGVRDASDPAAGKYVPGPN